MADPFSDEALFGDEANERARQTALRAQQRKEAPAHTAANYPTANLTNPSQFRMVVRNYVHAHSLATPQELGFGREWYPRVHEAVGEAMSHDPKIRSHFHGSGMVAALSPNMDFERTNIPAFEEIKHISPTGWDAIHRSANQPSVWSPEKGRPVAAPRSEEARNVLQGMSLSLQSDKNLIKAHRIYQGESPENVLPRQTSPKTHSFTWDIHDPTGLLHPAGPRGQEPHITVDVRHHDIGINRLYPWTYSGRGISSADLPSSRRVLKSGQPAKSFGRRTRYEEFESATRQAARVTGEEPIGLQAIDWTVGKRLEKEQKISAGVEDPMRGVKRHGQRYFPGRQALPSPVERRRS
jgi:hypothetical protein